MRIDSKVKAGPIVLTLLGLIGLCVCGSLLNIDQVRPLDQAELDELRVYAYRDWQSTIYTLHTGDSYEIQAEGEWLYSPEVGYHGPEGSRYHRAVASYPLPDGPGGVLLGRIGPDGPPFYVGAHTFGTADRSGKLYLRINDDRLGDNDGYLVVDLSIIQPDLTLPDAQPQMLTPASPSERGTYE